MLQTIQMIRAIIVSMKATPNLATGLTRPPPLAIPSLPKSPKRRKLEAAQQDIAGRHNANAPKPIKLDLDANRLDNSKWVTDHPVMLKSTALIYDTKLSNALFSPQAMSHHSWPPLVITCLISMDIHDFHVS